MTHISGWNVASRVTLQLLAVNMQSDRASKLMSVPRELREKIYINVFLEAEVVVHRDYVSDNEASSTDSAVTTSKRFSFPRRFYCYADNINIDVLGVSNQIRCEARPLLQSALQMTVFDQDFDIDDFPLALRSYLPTIERLTLYTDTYSPPRCFDTSCLPKLKLLTVKDENRPIYPAKVTLDSNSALCEALDTMFSSHHEAYTETWFHKFCGPGTKAMGCLGTLFAKHNSAQLKFEVRVYCQFRQPISIRLPGWRSESIAALIDVVFDFKSRKILCRRRRGVTRHVDGAYEDECRTLYTVKQVLEWLLSRGNDAS